MCYVYVRLDRLGDLAARGAWMETQSLAQRGEQVIMAAILAGDLEPGRRLSLPKLSEAYGIGVTPLREALSRLAERGLVVLNGNRGFFVSGISREDLRDITESRIVIEKAALARAFARAEEIWEDRLVAATHRLIRVARKSDGPYLEGSPEYDAAHKEFHAAIISGCGLARLMAVQESLYDAAYRYRRIMYSGRLNADRVCAIHSRLADLVLARDLDAASAELERHLMTTLKRVYDDDGTRSGP